jgi:hypothetical protein
MSKTLKELGQEAFNKNEKNFYRKIRKIIQDDESPFDETTRVKVFHNFHDGCEPYFQFHITTSTTVYTSDYHPYNFDFKKGDAGNLDEIITSESDVEIFDFFGNEIPLT